MSALDSALVSTLVPWLCLTGSACSGAKTAEDLREEACEKPENYERIEVLPPAATIPRPYRVIGAVEANFDGSSNGRLRTLRVKACRLGAHAVTFSERAMPGMSHGSGMVTGNHATVTMMNSGYTAASGLAIAYTDGAPSSADASARPR